MSECYCFSCEMGQLSDDQILEIVFEDNSGNSLQATEMYVREVEELLSRWICE